MLGKNLTAKRLPTKRRRFGKQMLLTLGICAALTILFQLLYPTGRALPSVAAAGVKVGGKSVSAIQSLLTDRYKQATLTIVADSQHVDTTLEQAGLTIDTMATARQAADYPWRERLIPFSSLLIMLTRNKPAVVNINEPQLRSFAEQASQTVYVAPVNAVVSIQDNKAILVPDRDGRTYSAESITAAIKQARMSPQTTLKLKSTPATASRQSKDLRDLLVRANKALDMSLTLSFEGSEVTVTRAMRASWLMFPEDKTGQLQLAVKPSAVKAYLDDVQAKQSTSRRIDTNRALDLISDAVVKGQNVNLKLPIDDVDLTALLDRTVQSNANMSIAVAEINGRSARASGDKQYTAASTYKLFVAYAVFQQTDSGKMHWTDTIINGKTVATCFNDMIVVSDNTCANAFGDAIGWQTIDTMMRGLGLSGTHVERGNHRTTANDLALLLYKLQSGTLVSSDNRDRQLNAMKRQIYRQGIPAGTSWVVADKVGFLDALLHDAGIVYSPKTPYVLVIMSNNGSWSQLASATRQIDNFLKQ
jgi:beta-lactamase class A